MGHQLAINTLVMAATGLLLACEAWYAWRRTRFGGHGFLALFLVTGVATALSALLLFRSTGEASVLRWAALWEALGTFAASFFFLFAARFVDLRALCGRAATAVLVGSTAALVVAVAAVPSLVYLPGNGLNALSFSHENVGAANGPLFWLLNVIFWVLVGGSAVLLLIEMRRSRHLRFAQALAAVIGVAITLGVQVSSMLQLVVLPGIHAGIVAVALGVPPILWALPGLRASDARVASERRTLEAMSDAVFVLDARGALASANKAAGELLVAGQSEASPGLDAERLDWFAAQIAAKARRLDDGVEQWSEEVIRLPLAGEMRPYHLRQTSICDSDGSRLSSVLVLRDVSMQMATETALRASEERLRILFEQSPVGILVFNTDLVAIEVNERWSECIGCESQGLLGKTLGYESLSSLLDSCRAALSGEPASFNGPLLTAVGDERWLECQVAPLRDGSGQISGGVCLAWDVTQSRRSEALIERLSFSDTVTGLPNRALFRDRLRRALADAARSGKRSFVSIVDIDGFATVNDALGHATADRLLETIGGRLRVNLRDQDTIARWSGDEFAVLAPSLSAADDALTLLKRIHDCFSAPWLVDGREIWLTASIGIALSPADGREAPELLSHAESALHSAKSQGSDSTRFYVAALSARSDDRLALAADLHRALAEEQLEVYYQPQVDMRDGRLVGCEALARWRHPDRALVGPDLFIPVAEESGLIVPIGEWVLRTACAQAARWTREGGGELRLGVNLSVRQLRQEDLVDVVTAALSDSGLAARQLELEVTETAILADPRAAAITLNRIAALGVSVALDDFGTGYSSLAHLCELPIDRLKIDRSFVGKLPEAREAAAVSRAVIDLAGNLGVEVIAEGVEAPAQVAFLCHHGCHEAQGYLFGRPVPAAEFDLRALRRATLAGGG